MSGNVLVAMSGGVDSSVAAIILRNQGYNCRGATMKLVDENLITNNHIGKCNLKYRKSCCSLADIEDARSVAYSLEMPFNVFNFTDDFRTNIIERFVRIYCEGSTPNPCIDCNRFMKFDKFFQRGIDLGFDFIATGHYARIEYDPATGRYLLKKGLDVSKDQSYVLYMMTQFQLSRTFFPIGELNKSEVRDIAQKYNLVTADKNDSQDICFVPDGDYASFIERYIGKESECGDFIDKNGKKLGRHRGIIRYTIGQRKGLGIAGAAPYYVCAKNAKDNSVILGDDCDLYSEYVEAADINLISCERIETPSKIKAKIRYRQNEISGTVEQIEDNKLRVKFDSKQKSAAIGQALVIYDGETIVGGGTICKCY
ncbi:MAG: tRNA 2-thiouridine(34) synthase MnmA [Planctomycetaceae bacterium]|jgi:tRNA-specific 2-thiouridylase|nr:tRNA 2-thiouridine(34) synthase MnmA [Planctomycetaceae bacterium]